MFLRLDWTWRDLLIECDCNEINCPWSYQLPTFYIIPSMHATRYSLMTMASRMAQAGICKGWHYLCYSQIPPYWCSRNLGITPQISTFVLVVAHFTPCNKVHACQETDFLTQYHLFSARSAGFSYGMSVDHPKLQAYLPGQQFCLHPKHSRCLIII